MLAWVLAGCASTTPNPYATADAWILNTGSVPPLVDQPVALKGKTGQTYQLMPAQFVNLSKVFFDIRRQSQISTDLGLIATSDLNAFATQKSGKPLVVLTLPMLQEIGSDPDALATTLGHEIAHLSLKHGDARKQRNETAQGVSHVLGVALGFAGIPMGGTIASMGVGGVTSAYSRDEEREADLLGMRWASEAGYSVCGVVRTMKLLQKQSTSQSSYFWSSHPGHEERIARANDYSVQLSGKNCEPIS